MRLEGKRLATITYPISQNTDFFPSYRRIAVCIKYISIVSNRTIINANVLVATLYEALQFFIVLYSKELFLSSHSFATRQTKLIGQ